MTLLEALSIGPNVPTVKMARRVSSSETADAKEQAASRKRARVSSSVLTRQVSHECVPSLDHKKRIEEGRGEVECGRGSPVHCVSEFDKFVGGHEGGSADDSAVDDKADPASLPPCPNPLHNASLLAYHTRALRLEAELQPLRLILSRLMTHPTFNRKGLFNHPVDPVSLKLPDYNTIVTNPMDLGTIKARLHAAAYQSRDEVIGEIRLVFSNAMKYNPPQNAVHASASNLFSFFEEQLHAFIPELSNGKVSHSSRPSYSESVMDDATAQADKCILRTVSSEIENSPLPQMNAHDAEFPDAVGRKRKKRGTRTNPSHNCQWCLGQKCALCKQGCLHLEPTLLICNGAACAGARIRKGSIYFIAPDGGRQYCQRCYSTLTAVIPSSGQDDVCRYKRDFLKRKNDEEVVERWLQCARCEQYVHHFCAMHNEYAHSSASYQCPLCVAADRETYAPVKSIVSHVDSDEEMYSFLSGSDFPVKLSDVCGVACGSFTVAAEALPETEVSKFIQKKVRERIKQCDIPHADQTVVVRVISDCQRVFSVPDIVRKHFRMVADEDTSSGENSISPPLRVAYRSKAVALFQKLDGLDVCIFCMYVHEYDNEDEYEEGSHHLTARQRRRVYIAYLDSVEHFRPRACRTNVYHEVLVAYLATARIRGYESAHIWACPPSRGNSFVFWNHPASQRTPSRERLVSWYHGALSRAMDVGVVTDVMSLYESDFQDQLKEVEEGPAFSVRSSTSGLMRCPPLLDGDFWIEEAVRIHGAHMARFVKAKQGGTDVDVSSSDDCSGPVRCPAKQVAALLRDRVLTHPCSIPFRRPVNAAALNLKDYHDVIKKPMDLGTVFSRVVLGEYRSLKEVCADVDLVFNNAKRYNPVGHVVHTRAIETESLFYAELDKVVDGWRSKPPRDVPGGNWSSCADVSMSLDVVLDSIARSPIVSTIETDSYSDDVADFLVGVRHGEEDPSIECVTGSVVTNDEASEESSSPATFNLKGPQSVLHRMVGTDTWLLDKRGPPPLPGGSGAKRCGGRRRKGDILAEDAETKRRRQAWLGEEVASSVRRMRTSFFTCSLNPEKGSGESFDSYTSGYEKCGQSPMRSRVADARHALLEFCQCRNLEFDTLRRAKYSTSVLLYHLHHDEAPGTVPICSDCKKEIEDVRWHKISRVLENRQGLRVSSSFQSFRLSEQVDFCGSCHSLRSDRDLFIPLQVSFHKESDEP